MVKSYSFTCVGKGAGGQTWTASGRLDSEFRFVCDEVMRQTFRQLTGGTAVYGRPGLGCAGPYEVDKIVIERID
jgi:hypothetical protein